MMRDHGFSVTVDTWTETGETVVTIWNGSDGVSLSAAAARQLAAELMRAADTVDGAA